MGSKFNLDDKSKVLAIYSIVNGNAVEAVRQLEQNYNISISAPTIRTYWRKEKYKMSSHGGRRVALHGGRGALSDEEIQEVLSFYDKYDGHTWIASLNEPYSSHTIKKYWELHGLEIKNRTNKSKRESIDDILED